MANHFTSLVDVLFYCYRNRWVLDACTLTHTCTYKLCRLCKLTLTHSHSLWGITWSDLGTTTSAWPPPDITGHRLVSACSGRPSSLLWGKRSSDLHGYTPEESQIMTSVGSCKKKKIFLLDNFFSLSLCWQEYICWKWLFYEPFINSSICSESISSASTSWKATFFLIRAVKKSSPVS